MNTVPRNVLASNSNIMAIAITKAMNNSISMGLHFFLF